VLAPTRELAIQVAEAFQRYAAHIPGFQVLPIYGGQSYGPQLHSLKRGVHVVVGTPGRVIDHLDKGTLDLSELRFLVLDEADEMLRMGFIDDVEKVLQATPPERQVALFSATMPTDPQDRAAHLKDPVEVTIKSSDHHRAEHPPALLVRQRHAQARCDDAHPRSRTVRRDDHLRAHQAGHRRTGRQSCRRAAWPLPPSMATSRRRSANA
jgi:superfamily II DNA/RNA helicase